MKSTLMVLALAAAMAFCQRDATEKSQAVPKERPVWLQLGYKDEGGDRMIVDYIDGRLWKEGGPDISYKIGVPAGDKARRYAQQILRCP